jgi:hypothetical protein
MLACGACSKASFIDKVAISNPTAYEARVDIASQSRDDWTPLTTVPADSEVVVQQVYDPGSTWVFRFGYLHYQQELKVPRSELERDGWKVTVPPSFGSTLEDQGISPPP